MAVAFLPNILINAIGGVVGEAIKEVSQRPDVPLQPEQAPEIAGKVAGVVVEQLQHNPQIRELEARIQHVTSTEAWYQSRANWSAIVSGLTPLLALAGYTLSPEDQIVVAGVLLALGNLLAGYLARRARTATKPLGAK